MSSLSVALVVALVLLAFGVWLFNRLVTLRNRHVNAFSQIDVQLQRRHELVPNLVETARAYLEHERETLTAVTAARDTAETRRREAAADPADGARIAALASAEGALGTALARMNMVVEAYPELVADERLGELHAELASTENRVGFARQAYSDAVMRYNVAREQFPALVVAALCGFREADPFEIADPALRAPLTISFAKAA